MKNTTIGVYDATFEANLYGKHEPFKKYIRIFYENKQQEKFKLQIIQLLQIKEKQIL